MPQFALDPDAPAMPLDDMAGDRQTQARAALAAHAVALVKTLEDALNVAAIHAWALYLAP